MLLSLQIYNAHNIRYAFSGDIKLANQFTHDKFVYIAPSSV